jgi:acyl-CoA thioesterase-1
MTPIESRSYLSDITDTLRRHWPANRTINIVCHGHSVPAGYFATPRVDSLNAYPHLLRAGLAERFPFGPVNVIVTAIGGENSEAGAARFTSDVLGHRPDLVTIDYGLNDRRLGLEKADAAWTQMIQEGTRAGIKLLLLTPTFDMTQAPACMDANRHQLGEHANQIRRLAHANGVGLVDSFAAFKHYIQSGDLSDLLSWSNHPNRQGHELVARELLRWFPAG